MPRHDNQSPSSECGEMRCSDLDVPLITFQTIDLIIKENFKNFSYEHWILLAKDTMHSDHSQLRNMCQILIDEISDLVLKDAKVQVLSKPHVHVPTDDKGTTSNPINGDPLYDGCSFCRVTEDDIQAAFDNLCYKYFGQVLGVKQKQSYDSDRLLNLFSAEITKNVNSALRNITGSTSLQSEESIVPSNLEEILVHVINMLVRCTKPQISPQATKVKKSDEDGAKTQIVSNAAIRSDEYLDFLDSLNLDCLDSEEDEPVQITNVKGFQHGSRKTSDIPPSTTKSTDSLQCPSTLPPPDLPKCSDDELFLNACLAKLVNHIANKTHTSGASLDCHQLVTRVKERIVEEQSYTVLQNSENLHITIYKELCCKFGSKDVLPVVMEKDDVAFSAAVAETLKAQLKKLAEENSFKKMWIIFRRNNKVAPFCPDKAPESHSEEHKQRNGATPSHQKTKFSRIRRTFSSMFNGLRKAFTCCITSED